MKKLIILTKHYPYDVGEEFIGNEMRVLEKFFEHITIIATCVRSSLPCRPIPQCVNAVLICDWQKPMHRYIKYILNAAFELGNPILNREIKKASSIVEKAAVGYAFARASRNAHAVHRRVAGSIQPDDTVFLYSYWFGDLALTALLFKKMINAKSIYTLSRAHGYDLYANRNRAGIAPFTGYLLEKINHVYPCSDNGTAYLTSSYREYAEKISTSYLGTKDHGVSRARLDGAFTIATCSSISAIKRVILLAQALKILCDSGTCNLSWICIGDGPLLADIKEYAAKNLGDMRVRFMGRMDNAEILYMYSESPIHVFVNTSEVEGLPVSIMEAMSFGIPAIATDVGGTKEIVDNTENGILLSKDATARELADTILYFVNQTQEERSIYRNKARKKWQQFFDADRNYALFAQNILRLSEENV